MAYFVKNLQFTEELFKHQYAGIDINALSANIDFAMLKEGYKLIGGQKGNGEYEKGNRTMRILFGAFVKYYKYHIRLKSLEDHTVELLVAKSSSGMSGGIIGMGQIKTELHRLAQVFTAV